MNHRIVNIKGIGPVAFGLNWLHYHELDNPGEQIAKLAKTDDAKWILKLKSPKTNDIYISLLGKDVKVAPFAAVELFKKSINSSDFCLFMHLEDDLYWILGVTGGMPGRTDRVVSTFDFVGELHECKDLAKDYLSLASAEVGIYTNCREKVDFVKNVDDVGNITFDYLTSSLAKTRKGYAKFTRYGKEQAYIYIFCAILLLAFAIWYANNEINKEENLKNERIAASKEAQRKKYEVGLALSSALNKNPDPTGYVENLLISLESVPTSIGGWLLSSAQCTSKECTLQYKPSSFATWSSYQRAKPNMWGDPNYGNGHNVLLQPLLLNNTPDIVREAADLNTKNSVYYHLGNLKQLSSGLQIDLAISESNPLVPGVATPEIEVPSVIKYSSKGSMIYLVSFVKRLPENSAISRIDITLGDAFSFNFNGETYARN